MQPQFPRRTILAARFIAARWRSHGFSAIEILTVISILGMLATLAAPSFKPTIERWRVNQTVEEVTNMLYVARAEAIKRGGGVSVSKISNKNGVCTFAPTNQDWSCGWVIFVDTDNDGVLDASEQLLQSFPAPSNVDVVNIGNTKSFRVNRWGQFNNLGAASFAITPRSTGSASPAATAVCVSAGGRIRVEKESVSCS